jgi:hypothetical protein
MTISVRQSDIDTVFSAPYTATLASTPVQGNLLIAVADDRSGATALTIDGTGWTLGEKLYQSPADGTFRKSHATWWKLAGASEPTTITITNAAGGGTIVGMVEFESDSGEMAGLSFGDSIATGYDTVATSYASGSTPSVASTEAAGRPLLHQSRQ